MDIKSVANKLAFKYRTRNPFTLASELGFIVLFVPLVEMRGFRQIAKRRTIICISDDLDDAQRMLVCAHEIGHHFLHGGMNRVFMDRSTRMKTSRYEIEANRFALEFLYADSELHEFFGQTISDVAAFMGVSNRLAEYRMSTVK